MNMYSSEVYKSMLSEVNTLIQLYLTIPVTTSTSERAFSVLRWLLTYLHSTMTEKGLNNCFFLHVHKDITDTLELTDIPKQFTAMHPERKKYFGTLVAKVTMTVLAQPLLHTEVTSYVSFVGFIEAVTMKCVKRCKTISLTTLANPFRTTTPMN